MFSFSLLAHLMFIFIFLKIFNTITFFTYLFIFQAFWDYTEKKQLGTTKAECSVTSEWSPDGCYFMTATTAPRLQVDNGYAEFYAYCVSVNLWFAKRDPH